MYKSLRYFLFALLFTAGALSSNTASAAVKVDISCGTIDFGTTSVGSSTDRTFTITDESTSSGNANIQLHLPSGNQFEIVGGWDPFTLVPGQSHTVTIRFTPTSNGTITDQIVIADNGDGLASANPYTVHFTGIGDGGSSDTTLTVCTCSWPSSFTLDFGTVNLGSTGSERFTILDNSSAATIRHLIGSVSGADQPFSVTFGQGNFDLTSGYGHDVIIGFTPAHSGSFFDSVIINTNSDKSTTRHIVIYLVGNGYQPANGGVDTSLTLSFNGTIPNNHDLDFGTIDDGKTATLTFVIQDASNPSTQRQLIGIVQSINPPFSITGGSGTFALTSGGLWTITVNFQPQTPGVYSDSIVIFSNADNANARRIVLYCTGVGKLVTTNNGGNGDSTASLAISGLTQVLNFGTVRVNDIGLRYFTITNNSDANITVTGNISSPGAPFSNATGNGGTFMLAQGAQQTVFVKFAPTMQEQYYDSIVVTSNAANMPRTIVYLVGTSGTAGVAAASIASGMSVYPNPFTSTSTLKLDLTKTSLVKVSVYNLLGQEVANLANGTFSAGMHSFDWNAVGLGNGTYLYRAQIGSETRTARVVLSK